MDGEGTAGDSTSWCSAGTKRSVVHTHILGLGVHEWAGHIGSTDRWVVWASGLNGEIGPL